MVLKKIPVPFILLASFLGSAQSFRSTYHYLDIDNEKMAYIEKGEGEVILLLHGWPQTSYTWRKVIPILSKQYKVIALDLPGLGASDATTNYDSKHIADKIHCFMIKMGIPYFHLVGHDIGAWIATTYSFLYENNLKSLCLIDAGIPGFIDSSLFNTDNAHKVWQFYFNQIEELPEFLIEGKEKEYLSWFFNQKSFIRSAISSDDLAVYVEAYKGKAKLKNGFNYYRAFSTSSFQNKKHLKKLTIPVLAIGGAHAVGNGLGNSLNNISHNLKSMAIDYCGHYVPEERPVLLSKLIIEMISNIEN